MLGPEPGGDGWSQSELNALQTKQQQQIKIAGEEAIWKVEPDDPQARQELRADNASVYAQQTSNKNSNLLFANSIGALLSDFMTQGTLVEIPGRGVIDPRQVRTRSELATAL